MRKKITDAEIASLVESDRVHKRVYTDPVIFELEMERIWGSAWIFVAHESQVPNSGDYLATNIGKQTVAEFVEDAASMSILWQCGVSFVQGNFLQEPEKVMSYEFS